VAKKQKNNEPAAEIVEKVDDRTPEQRLKDDWPSKHRQIAPYITMLGKVRGGLRPSQIKEAERILKSYGFEV
jgi:hypothetical protein